MGKKVEFDGALDPNKLQANTQMLNKYLETKTKSGSNTQRQAKKTGEKLGEATVNSVSEGFKKGLSKLSDKLGKDFNEAYNKAITINGNNFKKIDFNTDSIEKGFGTGVKDLSDRIKKYVATAHETVKELQSTIKEDIESLGNLDGGDSKTMDNYIKRIESNINKINGIKSEKDQYIGSVKKIKDNKKINKSTLDELESIQVPKLPQVFESSRELDKYAMSIDDCTKALTGLIDKVNEYGKSSHTTKVGKDVQGLISRMKAIRDASGLTDEQSRIMSSAMSTLSKITGTINNIEYNGELGRLAEDVKKLNANENINTNIAPMLESVDKQQIEYVNQLTDALERCKAVENPFNQVSIKNAWLGKNGNTYNTSEGLVNLTKATEQFITAVTSKDGFEKVLDKYHKLVYVMNEISATTDSVKNTLLENGFKGLGVEGINNVFDDLIERYDKNIELLEQLKVKGVDNGKYNLDNSGLSQMKQDIQDIITLFNKVGDNSRLLEYIAEASNDLDGFKQKVKDIATSFNDPKNSDRSKKVMAGKLIDANYAYKAVDPKQRLVSGTGGSTKEAMKILDLNKSKFEPNVEKLTEELKRVYAEEIQDSVNRLNNSLGSKIANEVIGRSNKSTDVKVTPEQVLTGVKKTQDKTVKEDLGKLDEYLSKNKEISEEKRKQVEFQEESTKQLLEQKRELEGRKNSIIDENSIQSITNFIKTVESLSSGIGETDQQLVDLISNIREFNEAVSQTHNDEKVGTITGFGSLSLEDKAESLKDRRKQLVGNKITAIGGELNTINSELNGSDLTVEKLEELTTKVKKLKKDFKDLSGDYKESGAAVNASVNTIYNRVESSLSIMPRKIDKKRGELLNSEQSQTQQKKENETKPVTVDPKTKEYISVIKELRESYISLADAKDNLKEVEKGSVEEVDARAEIEELNKCIIDLVSNYKELFIVMNDGSKLKLNVGEEFKNGTLSGMLDNILLKSNNIKSIGLSSFGESTQQSHVVEQVKEQETAIDNVTEAIQRQNEELQKLYETHKKNGIETSGYEKYVTNRISNSKSVTNSLEDIMGIETTQLSSRDELSLFIKDYVYNFVRGIQKEMRDSVEGNSVDVDYSKIINEAINSIIGEKINSMLTNFKPTKNDAPIGMDEAFKSLDSIVEIINVLGKFGVDFSKKVPNIEELESTIQSLKESARLGHFRSEQGSLPQQESAQSNKETARESQKVIEQKQEEAKAHNENTEAISKEQKAIEAYVNAMKKMQGDSFNEAEVRALAQDKLNKIKSGDVESLMGTFTNGNKASNAMLKIMTGMPVNNQKNRDSALRSLNEELYDQIIEMRENEKRLEEEANSFAGKWKQFEESIIGTNYWANETAMNKGKIAKAFEEYGETAKEGLDYINKLWLSGQADPNNYSGEVGFYLNMLNDQAETAKDYKNAKAGDLNVESLFGFGGTTNHTEETAQVLRDEAEAWDQLITRKREAYGLSNPDVQQEAEVHVENAQVLNEEAKAWENLARVEEDEKAIRTTSSSPLTDEENINILNQMAKAQERLVEAKQSTASTQQSLPQRSDGQLTLLKEEIEAEQKLEEQIKRTTEELNNQSNAVGGQISIDEYLSSISNTQQQSAINEAAKRKQEMRDYNGFGKAGQSGIPVNNIPLAEVEKEVELEKELGQEAQKTAEWITEGANKIANSLNNTKNSVFGTKQSFEGLNEVIEKLIGTETGLAVYGGRAADVIKKLGDEASKNFNASGIEEAKVLITELESKLTDVKNKIAENNAITPSKLISDYSKSGERVIKAEQRETEAVNEVAKAHEKKSESAKGSSNYEQKEIDKATQALNEYINAYKVYTNARINQDKVLKAGYANDDRKVTAADEAYLASEAVLNQKKAAIDAINKGLAEELKITEQIARAEEKEDTRYNKAVNITNEANAVKTLERQYDILTNKLNAYQTEAMATPKINLFGENIREADRQLNNIGQLLTRLGTESGNDFIKTAQEIRKAYEPVQKIFAELGGVKNSAYNVYNQTGANAGQAQNISGVDKGASFNEAKESMQEYIRAVDGYVQGSMVVSDTNKQITYSVKEEDGVLRKCIATWNETTGVMRTNQKVAQKQASSWDKMSEAFKGRMRGLVTYFTMYTSAFMLISKIKEGIGYIKELNTAITEMQVVTGKTDSQMAQFSKDVQDVANSVASTNTEITKSSTNWARLGYSMQDSLQLAKASAMYANVGFTDTETATSALTSVLQAFYNGVNDVGSAAEGAVDKFVKIGNNFAITSAELGEGLQESASAIVAAGGSIDEAIALTTAGE